MGHIDQSAYDNEQRIPAKKSYYNGIEFRSVLEAKTAQAFDNIGIKYMYEPQGYKLSNGVWYRPDFYLPDANQFVECKGVMSEVDSAKIVGLVEDIGLPVIALNYDKALMVMRFWNYPNGNIVMYSGDDVGLAWCTECGKARFFSQQDTYACPHCGAHDGDAFMRPAFSCGSANELFRVGQEMAANKPIYKEVQNAFNN